jgi:hypothetical protein
MITEQDIRRSGTSILLGIAVENAVLDILTSDSQLEEGLKLLDHPHRGLVSINIGTFGVYPVTLNRHNDDSVSVFVDGPSFDHSRSQSTGMYFGKEEFQRLLLEVLQGRTTMEL